MNDMSNSRFDGDRPASERPPSETVEAYEQCPDCKETRIDWLAWDDDGEYVTCATCGCVYVP